MTIQVLPFFDDPSWVCTTTLEGTTYNLQFDYNERCAAWYMSIADAVGVDIYNGVKLVTGFSLLKKCADPRKPPGAFLVFSSTSDLSPPQLEDLVPGGRCQLVYITSDWVALFASGQGQTIVNLLAANAQDTGTSTYGQG